jgi:hypothetical protein
MQSEPRRNPANASVTNAIRLDALLLPIVPRPASDYLDHWWRFADPDLVGQNFQAKLRESAQTLLG